MRLRELKAVPLALVAAGGLTVGLAMPAAAQETKHLISGSDLKPNSVTGKQIKESTLGTVPTATNATNAKTATNAVNATNATNAINATTLPALVWHPLTLKNSWGSYGHGYDVPAYAIDAQGIVHLRGAMQGSPSGSVAFSFPASILSPDVEAQYPIAANTGTIALMTVVDGAFCPLDGSAPAGSVAGFTDIDGITFAVS